MNEILRRRRALMAQKDSGGLPSEYQQVEYIGFSNSPSKAYINTNISGSSDFSIYANIYLSSNGTNRQDAKVIGEQGRGALMTLDGYFRLCRAGTSFKLTSIPATRNIVIPLVFVGTSTGMELTATVDGVIYTDSYTRAGSNRNCYICIGATQSDASTYNSNFCGRFCGAVVIYQNGDMVGNFIPCYRKSDEEIGMYDLVSKAFFTNAGTGTFTKGEDV